MIDEDGLRVQFVYIPDEDIHGILVDENPYYCFVEYSRNGILHREVFDQEEVVYLKEIHIPITTEGETE